MTENIFTGENRCMPVGDDAPYRSATDQSLKPTCLEARTCLENENPCLEKSGAVLQFLQAFMLLYINIPFKLIVSDELRIAIRLVQNGILISR